MVSLQRPKIRNIAVIGGGPGGVTAAKYLIAEQCNDRVVVFEQQSGFGGVWNYSSTEESRAEDLVLSTALQHNKSRDWLHNGTDTGPGSEARPSLETPMYDGLETNIPDIIMEHSNDRTLRGTQLFPPRETVLKYLVEYGADIAQHVRFDTQVIDARLRDFYGKEFWQVTSRTVSSQDVICEYFDAIVVASGHYSVPYVPPVKGIEAWNDAYPGLISHSKSYRKASDFYSKKTLLVGYSASGIDICLHLSEQTKLPILVSRRSTAPSPIQAPYKEDVAEISEFLPPDECTRAVRFADGRIECDLDAVIFCTGYFYSYPFLSSLEPSVIDTGERVRHLYQHVFHIWHNSLAFIGLPSKIIPFRTFECQAAVVAKVWAERLKLPNREEMERWENKLLEERGSGRAFHVLDYPKDFDYHNELVDWASHNTLPEVGLRPPKWTEKEYWIRKNIPPIKAKFVSEGERRHRIMTIEDLGFEY